MKHMKNTKSIRRALTVLLCAVMILALAACGDPAPATSPSPSATPAPTATPEATPEPTATPMPEPTTEPSDTPAPTETPEPTPEPEAEIPDGDVLAEWLADSGLNISDGGIELPEIPAPELTPSD